MFDNYEQENIASASIFRSLLGNLRTFDFHVIVEDFFGSFWGISRGLTVGIFFTGFMAILWRLIPDLPVFTFQWLFGTLPIWLPPAAIFGGWSAWVWYVRAH